jgi:hypothetical protein
MSLIWHDPMTQLSLASNQAEVRKFSRDAKMRSSTPEPEVARSKTLAVSRAWRRVSIIVVYRNADVARDYRGATDRQWHYDERRWRSKAQRLRLVQRTGVDACTTEQQRARSAPRRIRKMVQLEGRKAELDQQLTNADAAPPLLHPEMATFYREQVGALHQALQDDTEATRLKAGEILRSLVKEIVLTPGDGELKIDVRGDLAGILAVALKTKTPTTRAGVSQFEMVAGIGFEPMTFRL